ncbi:MAG: DUF998 domain-containing protein [Bacteroidia bacterium]|nr:DUF998 domain-containing protein [Bacteroidia bacterium]
MNGIIASWFGYLGTVFFIATSVIAGFLLPDYSPLSQLISESYASGTPFGPLLRVAGFLPSGLFLTIFAVFALRALPSSGLTQTGLAGIGIFYGIGTIVVSIFPCNEGCDNSLPDPGISQVIHTLSGVLTYTIVPLCLLITGISARKWPNGKNVSYSGIFCGITAILFVNLLSSFPDSGFTGLFQRIVEGSILIWIIHCAFYLGKHPQSAKS